MKKSVLLAQVLCIFKTYVALTGADPDQFCADQRHDPLAIKAIADPLLKLRIAGYKIFLQIDDVRHAESSSIDNLAVAFDQDLGATRFQAFQFFDHPVDVKSLV